jgi:hypothetical protein
METKDSYTFPLYHRIGQSARPVIASRYWIVLVLAVAILLYMPFLFSGFFQDDYGFRLQFSPEIFTKHNISAEVAKSMQNAPWNLYGFSWDATERFGVQQEKGFTPWWASDQIKTNFFRPLSSLTLALDFSLWPNSPFLMHLQSMLWFCLLILLTYQLYRSISGSLVAAGISILLFVINDVMSGPVGWISNRHALVAMVFCVLCVWLYHQAVSKRNGKYLAAACGAYALALLASEMGLVALAYLFAYLVALDRASWPTKIKRILPFLLMTAAWRLTYVSLGYGATGTALYIDPMLDPIQFLTQMFTRIPMLLFSVIGFPVADMFIALSPESVGVAAAVLLVPLGLLAWVVFPVLKAHRTSGFWAIGLLCAAVPLVAGIPQTRNLGLVSLGVMGLAGQLFVDVAKAGKPGLLTKFQRIMLKLTVPILVFCYLVVSPIIVLATPTTTKMSADMQARAADFGSEPELAAQHLSVINPPGAMSFMAGLFQRLFSDKPFPLSIHYLSSGFAPVRIERVDARTLLVTPEGGYTPLPGPITDAKTGIVSHFALENVYRALDGFSYNPQNPMHAGQSVVMLEVTVEVIEMTGDGRIAKAKFTFAHPLDDTRYVWLLWDADTSTYARVQMPPVGESRIYP